MIAPELYSKTFQFFLVVDVSIGNPSSFKYMSSPVTSMALCNAYDNLVYFFSVEDKAHSICRCDLCSNVYAAYNMAYPYIDMEVSVSSVKLVYHLNEEYSSTYTSKSRPFTSLITTPLSCVPFWYQANNLTRKTGAPVSYVGDVTSTSIFQIIQVANN